MKKIDLTGKVFGKLTVVKEYKDASKRLKWICKCNCGCDKQVIVTGQYLRCGDTKSCGRNTNRLNGMRFGKLVVIEYDYTLSKWKCLCDCGNTTFVSTGGLKNTKSCGCILGVNSFKHLTGKRFGRLLVIEKTTERKNNSVVWKCICDCGNLTFATTAILMANNKKSCGCLSKEGNLKAIEILKKGNQRRKILKISTREAFYQEKLAQEVSNSTTEMREDDKQNVSTNDKNYSSELPAWVAGSTKLSNKPLTTWTSDLSKLNLPPERGNRFIDRSGARFNNWLVIDLEKITKQGAFWNCVCVCGTKSTIAASSLGRTIGCRNCFKQRKSNALSTESENNNENENQ